MFRDDTVLRYMGKREIEVIGGERIYITVTEVQMMADGSPHLLITDEGKAYNWRNIIYIR